MAKKKSKAKAKPKQLKLKPGHYRVTLVLHRDETETLQALGREDDLSLSWMVRRAIRNEIERLDDGD